MKIKIPFYLLLLFGCNGNEVNIDEQQIELHRDYIEQQTQGDKKSYIHYISLKGGREEYFDFMPILKDVKSYYDTCTTKTPIEVVCIIRKNKEHHFENGEPDYVQVYKDALLELYFEITDTTRVFPLRKISFFENGKHKEIKIDELNTLVNSK